MQPTTHIQRIKVQTELDMESHFSYSIPHVFLRDSPEAVFSFRTKPCLSRRELACCLTRSGSLTP